MNKQTEILLLGAGVSGLSTGILLLQKGYKATIWAKDLPPNTTSNKAAAVWYPFICGPKDKATLWAKASLDYFRNHILSEPEKETGCMKTTVVEVFDHHKKDPWWKEGVDTFQRITPDKLPVGYIDGYEIAGLVMDTDVYMEYLVHMFHTLGGTIIQKEVIDITEPLQQYSIIINKCTQLGLRLLIIIEYCFNGFVMSIISIWKILFIKV